MMWPLRIRIGRRGTASIEFAIAVPVILMLMGWTYDLSNLLVARIQLSNGVGNAADYAILTGANVSGATLVDIVQKTSRLTGATATVTGPACYCVTYDPTAPLASANCGASCSNGINAAAYVTVIGSYTYAPLLPGLSTLTTTVLTETASVKLQ